jgi:hypothetical protein
MLVGVKHGCSVGEVEAHHKQEVGQEDKLVDTDMYMYKP